MVFRANLKARYSGGSWRGGGGQAQSCGGIMAPCGRRDRRARGGWHTTYAWRLVGLVSSAVEDKNRRAVGEKKQGCAGGRGVPGCIIWVHGLPCGGYIGRLACRAGDGGALGTTLGGGGGAGRVWSC